MQTCNVETTSFFGPGRRFVFEMADGDVSDRYRFVIEGSARGLEVRFEGVGEGTWRFADAALEKARSFLLLAQGGTIGSDGESLPKEIKRDLPPFLLSRKVFAELMKGPSKLRPEWGEDEIEIAVVARGRAVLRVDGKRVEHDAFRVQGDDLDLWVLDDARWPLVVWREENDNYWHLVAHGEDVELKRTTKDAAAHDLIVGEAPFHAGKRKSPATDVDFVELVRGAAKSSPKERTKAIEQAAKKLSPEVRDALFAAFGDALPEVRRAAAVSLRNHESRPDYAEGLRRYLETLAKAVTTDAEPDTCRLATNALSLVRSAQLGHRPLAELVRTIASAHESEELRDYALALLVRNLEDDVVRRQLLERVRRGERFERIALAQNAILSAVFVLPAQDARDQIEAIIGRQPEAQRDELWGTLVPYIATEDPGWVRVLLDWCRAASGSRRDELFERVKGIRRWGDVLDLQNPKHVEELIGIDLEAKDQDVSDAIEEALVDVTDPPAVERVLSLLSHERDHARGGSTAVWLMAMYDRVSSDTLAPLFARIVPQAVLDDHAWIQLAETLLDREEPEWKPVLQAIQARIEAKEDPETFGEILATLRAR